MTYDGISASELRSLRHDIGDRVDRLAESVRTAVSLQKELQGELEALREQFDSFVEEDRRARNMHFAQTSLVGVRAQLDRKFGHHETVRRNTIGMLQAMDAGIVTQATLRRAAEDRMLDAPGYWLAPVQVALANWIQDDPEVADSALLEAVSRDPNKAALFFSLVLTRYGRHRATAQWIRQYFDMQSRMALSTEFPVVLDAAAQGALGVTSRGRVAEICIAWIEQLSRNYDLLQKQVLRWRERMDKERLSLASEFSVLPAICPAWNTALKWLEGATVHAESERWLRARLDAATTPDEDVRQRVDEILRNLITDYDEAEAPLREEAAEWLAVIKSGGKQTASKSDGKVREKRVDFLSLLTDIAISPDETKHSVVTQQFAIGMASKWVEQAARNLAAASRSEHPGSLEISIHGWKRKVQPSDKEEILTAKFDQFVDTRLQHDVKDVEAKARRRLRMFLAVSASMVVTAGLLLGFRTASSLYSQILLGIALFILMISAVSLVWARNRLPNQTEDVQRTWATRRENGKENILAALAEIRKLFGQWEAAIAKEASLIDFINEAAARQMSILPWEDAPSAPGSAESSVRTGSTEMPEADSAIGRLALSLPDWDLLPPHVATPPG